MKAENVRDGRCNENQLWDRYASEPTAEARLMPAKRQLEGLGVGERQMLLRDTDGLGCYEMYAPSSVACPLTTWANTCHVDAQDLPRVAQTPGFSRMLIWHLGLQSVV